MWWKEQSEARKSQFKTLLFQTKQIEFVLGAFAMNDEACPTYSAIIDQFTLGHQWLLREFGIKPKIGWQIDPFGSSSVMATLYKDMGFKYHVIARIDHQEKDRRRAAQEMEFLWRGSKSRGNDSEIFTHILYDSYCNPSPFIWENSYFPGGSDYDESRNPMVTSRNIDQVAKDFVLTSKSRARAYKHNHLLFTFGCDFTFRDANRFFGNLTLIRDYVNARSDQFGVEIQYSTLTEYFETIHSENHKWPIVEHRDFFPYSDGENAYWTGYFSSYPVLKQLTRIGETSARSAETLAVTSHVKVSTNLVKNFDLVQPLRRANGELQHHDGVTGTAKQHVRNDYFNKILGGMKGTDQIISSSLGALISMEANKTVPLSKLADLSINPGEEVKVVFYNSLGCERKQVVKIGVRSKNVHVIHGQNVILSQVNEAPAWRKQFAPYDLFFKVEIPAMGYNVYKIRGGSIHVASKGYFSQKHIFDTFLNKSQSLQQGFGYYESYQRGGQQSGAYIFRPNSQQPTPLTLMSSTQVDGPLTREIRQDWGDVKQVVRMYSDPDSQFIELDIDAGVIPKDRELVLKVKTNIKNEKKIHTDDNALESLERIHRTDRAEYTSSNYYPVQYSAFIKDKMNQVSVIMNHTVGAASMHDGEMEVMIHRRTTMDDARGVDEPVNDESILRTTIRLVYSPVQEASKLRHKYSYHVNFPLEVYHLEKNSRVPIRSEWSPLTRPLPPNIHLLTLETVDPLKKEFILRFAHIFEKGTGFDDQLTQPVEINIRNVFSARIVDIKRVSLSTLENCTFYYLISHLDGPSNGIFTLKPIEIATFIIKFQ